MWINNGSSLSYRLLADGSTRWNCQAVKKKTLRYLGLGATTGLLFFLNSDPRQHWHTRRSIFVFRNRSLLVLFNSISTKGMDPVWQKRWNRHRLSTWPSCLASKMLPLQGRAFYSNISNKNLCDFQCFWQSNMISTHRDFANFCLTSEVGKALRLWLQVLFYFKAWNVEFIQSFEKKVSLLQYDQN